MWRKLFQVHHRFYSIQTHKNSELSELLSQLNASIANVWRPRPNSRPVPETEPHVSMTKIGGKNLETPRLPHIWHWCQSWHIWLEMTAFSQSHLSHINTSSVDPHPSTESINRTSWLHETEKTLRVQNGKHFGTGRSCTDHLVKSTHFMDSERCHNLLKVTEQICYSVSTMFQVSLLISTVSQIAGHGQRRRKEY